MGSCKIGIKAVFCCSNFLENRSLANKNALFD
nr:MAG TPA: hypothetical protein [Caudoviricetes sp.]